MTGPHWPPILLLSQRAAGYRRRILFGLHCCGHPGGVQREVHGGQLDSPAQSRDVRYVGCRAANSPVLRFLARAGLTACGVMYVVIGWIAVQIAFGHSRQQADRTGALHVLGGNWFGEIALWLLVVGFAGLALWRLTEAIYGTPGDNDKATTRITSFGKAVTYTVITYGVLKYALGIGAPKSSDTQSVDLTATAMSHPGGRAVVIIAALALIGAGIALAYSAARKHFLKKLATGQMRPRTGRP